ncbi:hypothetical protein [Candidatus Nitrososphaera evergladensis]|nr:hypothetical protein [Candidatus Nitrososphaera evergladensis]
MATTSTLKNPSGNLAPIKAVFYKELQKQAQSTVQGLLKTGTWYPIDASGLGNFPWYWNNTGIFNTNTWNWFNNIFSYNKDTGYLETHDSSLLGGLFNTYLQISYALSSKDNAAYNDAANKAAAIINTVVGDYTTMFGAIPPEKSGTAAAKMDYVTQQILSWAPTPITLAQLRTSLNPLSLLGNAPFGSSKIITDFMSYLNQTAPVQSIQNAIATQNAEIQRCAANLQPAPSTAQPGWMNTQDSNGNASIQPYLNIAQSTANIQNALCPTSGGASFSVGMTVNKIDQNTVKVSASGGAAGEGWIDLFTFGGGASASYDMFSFDQTLKTCNINLTFKGVTTVTPMLSGSAYQASSGTGWWNPDVIKQAVQNQSKGDVSGLKFTTPPVYDYKTNGTFGVLGNIIISQLPTFSLTYTTSNTKIFQQTFQEQSSWNIGFLGIPIAGGKQSYYSSQYSADTTKGTVTVTMSPPANDTPVSLLDQLAYVIGAEVIWPGN